MSPLLNTVDPITNFIFLGEPFHDVTEPKEEVSVKPIEEQGEMETQKLWQNVAKGIRAGDFNAVTKEKSKIEVRHCLFEPLSR